MTAPVTLAGRASRAAAVARDKAAWLALFADDAIVASGYRVVAEGVFTYRVNSEGKIAALRAYWELEKAAASATPV